MGDALCTDDLDLAPVLTLGGQDLEPWRRARERVVAENDQIRRQLAAPPDCPSFLVTAARDFAANVYWDTTSLSSRSATEKDRLALGTYIAHF